ncbi:translation initiation factor IF-5A [Candidatus Woesearchaeota archaeon]|nr:translation initiation factor IF-5A [Candidatus Woesearchaeota archaeon]MCF7901687.1 translation initiation factor IF-5A [Candidatus Woesearchaeota archaeon]MCF8014055.1 translation initiation factor IF-5A [Candidatus Woesearchaeota archaeon]
MAGEISHKSAGSLQKGNYVIVDGVACTVTDIATSRPGKHGHAKVNMMAVGILDGKKRNMVCPGHDNVEVPVIDKRNATVLHHDNKLCSVMDTETYENFDLEIPDELKGDIKDGQTVVYWVILQDKVLKQIKNE